MIIDDKLLEIIKPSGKIKIMRVPKARVQLKVDADSSSPVVVQELDGMSNVKKQYGFEAGFGGFWKAVAKFEELVAEGLGIKEVIGFEVGMIFKLNQDTKLYKKGDILACLEVDANGMASKVKKMTPKDLVKIKKSRYTVKLRKSDNVDFLLLNGLKTFDNLSYKDELTLKGVPEIVEFDRYKNYIAGMTIDMPKELGGGSAIIDSFGFEKGYTAATYFISVNLIYEEGRKGRAPLNVIV